MQAKCFTPKYTASTANCGSAEAPASAGATICGPQRPGTAARRDLGAALRPWELPQGPKSGVWGAHKSKKINFFENI